MSVGNCYGFRTLRVVDPSWRSAHRAGCWPPAVRAATVTVAIIVMIMIIIFIVVFVQATDPRQPPSEFHLMMMSNMGSNLPSMPRFVLWLYMCWRFNCSFQRKIILLKFHLKIPPCPGPLDGELEGDQPAWDFLTRSRFPRKEERGRGCVDKFTRIAHYLIWNTNTNTNTNL